MPQRCRSCLLTRILKLARSIAESGFNLFLQPFEYRCVVKFLSLIYSDREQDRE